MRRTKRKKMPNVQIVVDRTHLCTKDAHPIKTQLLKRQRENKISSTQQWQKNKPNCYKTNSTVSAINISVLVAEVLSKIRSTFNTMSYSDIINVVSISASRIFGDKIEGQKVHDSIKNASKHFHECYNATNFNK